MPTIIVLLSNTLLDLIAISHLIKIVYPQHWRSTLQEDFKKKRTRQFQLNPFPSPIRAKMIWSIYKVKLLLTPKTNFPKILSASQISLHAFVE